MTMIAAIMTMGDIIGNGSSDRKVVQEAQRNLCMSSAFWSRIKKGDIPYVYNKDTGNFREATYTETTAHLNRGVGEVYWVTDEEYPRVKKALEETHLLSQEINKKQSELNKYRK